MKIKNLALEISVILACYLVMTIPVASATSVNIIFNGQTMESVDYDPTNIVNQHITYVKDPRDVAWSNIRVAITLNSASLAHTIKRVYLYKCGSLAPASCLQKTPEVFDSYIDTEIAWDDIAQSSGQTKYPQEGNLLFLVKLEDPDGLTSWTGLWNTIRRTSHKEFFFYRHELSDVDVYAKSLNMVGPIASYIQNFNAIPFRWLTKASFSDAVSIAAIGGDDRELDTSPPALQSVEPTGTDISVINKENYFVFPQTSSGFAFPITLEQNPDFVCGDGKCESNLGETQETCCYDCGCQDGYYCDTPQGSPEEGSCKNDALVNLDVVGTPSAEVSDCTHSFELGVTARINNPPVGLEDDLTGVIKIYNKPYAVHCTKSSPGLYDCSLSMMPTIKCGSGTRDVGPNELKLTVSYSDGKNKVTRDLTELFPAVSLSYDCGCPNGYYCDTGSESCQSEEAITLGITELTSYLDDYTPGDTIGLTAKVFNPPTGMVLISASAGLNLTKQGGIVSPGTPQCTGPSEDYEYECSIPFSITGYQESDDYKFFPNFLSFQITYNDADSARTRTLTTEFGPLSIPSQDCGNGVCNQGEDSDSCCADCGCPVAGDYCDRVRGCSPLSGITLSAIPYPLEVEDCKKLNEVNLKASIANAPYGVVLDYYDLTVNYQPVPWKIDCPKTGEAGGIFNCMFEIQPIEGCELPHFVVGPNRLTFTVSFPNGASQQNILTRELNTTFSNIYIIPVPHIDGVCESNLGENGSTACLDCPCIDDPAFGEGYYCDAGPDTPEGTCLAKTDVTLVVETPTEPVRFSSCEEINKVNVLVHVRNQPTDMDIENYYASLGGEAARYIACSQTRGIYLDSNVTLNCTIGIPPIDTCSQGMTYNYSNNSISLIISYKDGQKRKVLQTLTAGLPEFYIHQTIRSLYDITEDAQRQMRQVLDNVIALTEKTMDTLEKCIKMQMIVMIINLVMSLAMGYAGGSAAKAEGGEFFDGFGKGMQTGSEIGKSFSEIIAKWCDTLKQMNEIELKLQKMQMKKIAMEMCLAINQHHLDSGDCRGNEDKCFSEMTGCFKYIDEMEDIMEDIGKDFSQINRNFIDMNDAIANIGDAFGGDGGTGDFYFQVSIGGNLMAGNDKVCKYSGKVGLEEICSVTSQSSRASIYVSGSKCSKKYVYLVLNPGITNQALRTIAKINDDQDVRETDVPILNLIDALRDGENTIMLFCSDEASIINYNSQTSKFKQIGDSIKIYKGTPIDSGEKRCWCEYPAGTYFYGINSRSSSPNSAGNKISNGGYPILATDDFVGYTDSEFKKYKNQQSADNVFVTPDSGEKILLLASGNPYCDSLAKYMQSGYNIWVKVNGVGNVAQAKMQNKELWGYIGWGDSCESDLKKALNKYSTEGSAFEYQSEEDRMKFVIPSEVYCCSPFQFGGYVCTQKEEIGSTLKEKIDNCCIQGYAGWLYKSDSKSSFATPCYES